MNDVLNEVETVINDAAPVVGALVPGAAPVVAGLGAVEGVVNTVVNEAPHQTALTDIGNAVTAATPIITAAGNAAGKGAQVTAGVSALDAVLAFLKSIL